MSDARPNEKLIRIALALREATVLDEPHWEAFAKQAGLKTYKGVMDILNQEVSLAAFKDLMYMDIRALVPGGKAAAKIEQELNAPVKIFPGEIAYILRQNQPDVAKLCKVLIALGLVELSRIEAALERAERNALNVYDVLVAEGIITPENIEKVVASKTADFAMDNRILLAGDVLVFNNLVTREDFARALESRAVTKAPLSRTLEDLNILSQAELLEALQLGLELPMVEILAYDVASELLERFAPEFMRRQLFIPLALQDNSIEIATADPFNLSLSDTITFLTGRRVSLTYSPHQELLAKFESLPTLGGAGTGDRLASLPPTTVKRVARPVPKAPVAPRPTPMAEGYEAKRVVEPERPRSRPEPYVDNLSTVQLVTQIMESAIASGATDIHIEPQADEVRVRYRIDGVLHNIMRIPTEMHLSVTSRIKVLASMNVTERRRPQDGHFTLETENGVYDFRISTLPSVFGETVVMRVLDSSRVMTGLDQLGLLEDQLKGVERLIARPYGLVLVTGPTGSGKTSTLYACLSAVNREGVNIITIEDPVEYQLPGITQVQVDPNIDLTFAAGLRSALRQDPDIIMVGEIRDADTAATAIRAALTGHLVFSTLHTNTAVGAISALAHLGIDRYLIASAISGIIAQRLVRKICEECKKPFAPTKALLVELGMSENSRRRFYKGEGCPACLRTGYKGRTGIFEVIEVRPDIRKAIAENAQEEEVRTLADKYGPRLFQAGLEKVLKGVTTPSEMIKAVTIF
ncbi:MAG: GspE/PulE family protein [Candidatus Sumerlaeaceae bacterium]|nr:GspE/PulE family protein [Candidatus Sumerlaeaceae bacterium]